ncbi:MAG TPA: hypothetical protein VHB21_19100 [Minicystis sp.]|nr:hypothetical protein [Minicystis sp.]
MKATYACVNGVQGDAKIDVFSKDVGRVRGEMLVFAVNPDRVRFDVVSPFGATLYTLTSDGRHFQMLDTKEKRFLDGPASPCNLARLTQVPIPGHALVALLRGEAPVLVHQPSALGMRWDDGGYYVVDVPSTRDAHEELHLGIRPEDFSKPWREQRIRVLDVRVVQRGVELYHAELSRHEAAKTAAPRVDPDHIDPDIPPSGPACDTELPRAIRVSMPTSTEPVILQYKDAKWNPPILPGAFSQPVPGGVHREYVDCGKDSM